MFPNKTPLGGEEGEGLCSFEMMGHWTSKPPLRRLHLPGDDTDHWSRVYGHNPQSSKGRWRRSGGKDGVCSLVLSRLVLSEGKTR